MADTRKSKTIIDSKDIEFLVNTKESDITTSYIMNTFGEFDNGIRFNPYDIVTIPPNSYGPEGKKNKNAFTTTVGLFIFNKFFIEEELFDILGYINKTITDKEYGNINSILSTALIEDKITTAQLNRYLQKTQKFMPYVSIFAPNYTDKMLACTRVINIKKRELLKKYKDQLAVGDEVAATNMEKELLDYAVDYLKDDPSMDMFLSGARGNIHNNFKNMFVMKGVIKDPDPNAKQKYKVASSCYIDGISPEEYALFANSLAAGPYARAKKTEDGGYKEKLFLRAYQHLTLDEKDSDCGTTRTIKVTLTPAVINDYMYSYIVEGDKLIELTSENKAKYLNKTVKMRFSALCKSKTGFCNKCAGNLYYRLNKTNVGTALTQPPSTLKNIAMKAFHDSTQQLATMDLETIFGTKG